MRHYDQLTLEQRYHLYALCKMGKSQKEMAETIGVHPSTISRELRRNKGKKGYRPLQAHRKAMSRRKRARRPSKWTALVIYFVEKMLKEDFSPEQISGRLYRCCRLRLSPESIYQHIWKDKKKGGTLYLHLRINNGKKKRKRRGSKDSRGHIKNRISIDKRPDIVEKRSRIGDWEIDTVIGKDHKGALLTIVERKTKWTLVKQLAGKHSVPVTEAVIDLMKGLDNKVHTITADNGKEFAGHEDISKSLEIGFYFAHPYHSWERGLNENTNGLIRQYFPKGISFENITDEDVAYVMDRLNNRPRKSLEYATPNEVFFGEENVKIG